MSALSFVCVLNGKIVNTTPITPATTLTPPPPPTTALPSTTTVVTTTTTATTKGLYCKIQN